ncbi:hypothetical protein HAX54_001008 [Datura stramonium]|uniref:Uncharacterized protein n=1 Tax=Datura stramonium TaxID=4076 RepID=A0ABS8T2H4_DATST|nr:hypothetical protein [Datura stramonium]
MRGGEVIVVVKFSVPVWPENKREDEEKEIGEGGLPAHSGQSYGGGAGGVCRTGEERRGKRRVAPVCMWSMERGRWARQLALFGCCFNRKKMGEGDGHGDCRYCRRWLSLLPWREKREVTGWVCCRKLWRFGRVSGVYSGLFGESGGEKRRYAPMVTRPMSSFMKMFQPSSQSPPISSSKLSFSPYAPSSPNVYLGPYLRYPYLFKSSILTYSCSIKKDPHSQEISADQQEVREGQSNILQSDEEIIKEFIEVMNKEGDGGGEKTPTSAKERESSTHLSSPKWDGTPNPVVISIFPSQTLVDNDVPVNIALSNSLLNSLLSPGRDSKGTSYSS